MSPTANTNLPADTLGPRLRDRREAVDLSVEGLAYKAGVSMRTIERIEAGESVPRRATLTVIEAALDAEPVPEGEQAA